MAAPETGPCGPWITEADVRACCTGLAPSPDSDAAVERAIAFVTPLLFRLSGRQFPGECSRTVRPCAANNCGCAADGWAQWPMGWSFWDWDQAAGGWAFPSLPYRVDGEWFNSGSCCGSCYLPCVDLPRPIAEVTEVKVDGVVLDPSAYAVAQFSQLCRLDGLTWPCTQDLKKADTEPGTWSITYTYGRGPGPDGVVAAAIFACQVAKSLCGSDDCVLPARLKHLVREGVEMDFADPLTFLDDGKVGIYEVDMWITSVNKGRVVRRSTVRRLDAPRRFRGFT